MLNNININIGANSGSKKITKRKNTATSGQLCFHSSLLCRCSGRDKFIFFFYLISRLSQFNRAVSWFRTLVAGFSSRRNMFDPTLIHVGLAVGEVAWGQIFPRVLLSFSLRIIPPVFHMQISFVLAVRSFV